MTVAPVTFSATHTPNASFGQNQQTAYGGLLVETNGPHKALVAVRPGQIPDLSKTGKFVIERLISGVVRPFRMLLRPVGIAELFVHHIPFLGFLTFPLIAGKHFIEGLLHVDGFVGKRDWAKFSPFGPLSGHRQYGRSLADLLKGKPEHWESLEKAKLHKTA